jgi:hypothetical protein
VVISPDKSIFVLQIEDSDGVCMASSPEEFFEDNVEVFVIAVVGKVLESPYPFLNHFFVAM